MKLLSDRDSLFKDSSILLLGTIVGGLGNFLFQMVMGRMLTPEDMGILCAMSSLFLISGVATGAIQAHTAKFTAQYIAVGRGDTVGPFARRMSSWLAVLALPVLCLALAFSRQISDVFQIPSVWPVIITALISFLSLFSPVAFGLIQGCQQFRRLSLVLTLASIVKLLFGCLLVYIGLKAVGALTGILLAVVTIIGFVLVLMRKEAQWVGKEGVVNGMGISEQNKYFWQVLVVAGATTLIQNVDLVIVKHVFPPLEAGVYAQAGTIARMVNHLTGPIVMVMFPKVVYQSIQKQSVRATLVKAISLSLLVTVGATGVCSVMPQLPVAIFFGAAHENLFPMVPVFAWALAPLPILTLFVNILMARNSFAFLPAIVVLSVSYVLTIAFWHPGWIQVVTATGLYSTLMMIAVIGYAAKSFGTERGAEAPATNVNP